MAQAVSIDTRTAFLAKLVAPLPARSKPAADRKYLRELRREIEGVWNIALHRFYAARALRDHCAHSRRADQLERVAGSDFAAREDDATLAMLTAVDRMMHIPAPAIGALRQKEKLRGFNGGRERWDAAIAADRSRLVEAL